MQPQMSIPPGGRCRGVAAALVLLVLWIPAVAVALTLGQDDRSVSTVFSDGTPAVVDEPDPGELVWVGTSGSASQMSSIGMAQLAGSASVSTFSDVEFVGGAAVFDITFSVDSETPFDFSVEFQGDGISGNFVYRTSLTGGGGAVFDFLDFAGDRPVEYDFAGLLPADNYRFVVSNSASGGNGSGGFDFTFNIVPEPGTALLLGAGLVALALNPGSPSPRPRSDART